MNRDWSRRKGGGWSCRASEYQRYSGSLTKANAASNDGKFTITGASQISVLLSGGNMGGKNDFIMRSSIANHHSLCLPRWPHTAPLRHTAKGVGMTTGNRRTGDHLNRPPRACALQMDSLSQPNICYSFEFPYRVYCSEDEQSRSVA
uniref:Uncharacterized protein n=1 Tax=Timema shepardi TaxID=629360 RepID=A0A7R9G753_TIMSH|nr:unnamed protein product [Timema shepardi]